MSTHGTQNQRRLASQSGLEALPPKDGLSFDDFDLNPSGSYPFSALL